MQNVLKKIEREVKFMSLYRCAMCGSTKIVLETKQEGYNKKKGIWGAVLFGGIGALALIMD